MPYEDTMHIDNGTGTSFAACANQPIKDIITCLAICFDCIHDTCSQITQKNMQKIFCDMFAYLLEDKVDALC